jgi:hypothetical protein
MAARRTTMQTDRLSEQALNLLRRRIAQEQVEVTSRTREAYRELATVGIMFPMHSFAKGDESVYWFTEEGWNRRYEFTGEAAYAKECG